MENRDRVALVTAALVYALVQCAFGVVLTLAAASRGHVAVGWLDVVKLLGRSDVGAFALRWLLGATRGLQRGTKFLVGMGLVIDDGVRAGLLVGVLRGKRAATLVAAVLYTTTALAGIVVAGLNPPIPRLVSALLGVALAVVVVLEVRRTLSGREWT
jgi:hypothetical protein